MSAESRESLQPGRPVRGRVIENPRLARYQHMNALVTACLGLLGVVLAIVLTVRAKAISGIDVLLFLGFFIPIQLGVTVGFHRHFCHRSFLAGRRTRAALAILGSMAAQGPVVFWVALHRMHHEFADRDGDPHSPNLVGTTRRARIAGLAHAYVGWITKHAVPNGNFYAKDLLRDPQMMRINRRYYLWVAIGLAAPAALGGVITGSWGGLAAGFVWGGLLRMFVGHNMIWWITSFAHVIGRRDYRTADSSTNNIWIAIPTLGESWHNNHHSFPSAATLNFRWWQLDLSGATIKLLEGLGLARNLVVPSKTALRMKRICGNDVQRFEGDV